MWALWATLVACNLLDRLDFRPEPLPCDRVAWYPDTDGDGVGDTGTIYVGCDEPDGYTLTPPPGPDTDDTDTDG